MTRLGRHVVRLLLCCYPRTLRDRQKAELEEAFAACVERESRRLGPWGSPYVRARLVIDALTSGTAMRLDEWRLRRARPDSMRAPKETRMKSLWHDVKYAGRI